MNQYLMHLSMELSSLYPQKRKKEERETTTKAKYTSMTNLHLDALQKMKARRGSKWNSIGKSLKKYEEDVFMEETDTISQLETKDNYERVNLHIKVLKIMKLGRSTTGANVQEVLIGDATGLA